MNLHDSYIHMCHVPVTMQQLVCWSSVPSVSIAMPPATSCSWGPPPDCDLLPCFLTPPTNQSVPEASAPTAVAHTSLQQQHHHHHHHHQHSQQDSRPIPTPSQAVPPRPAFASSSLAAPASYWSTSAGGWVVALSLLFAVRQGREHADAARLDVRALQARQQDSRVQVGGKGAGYRQG